MLWKCRGTYFQIPPTFAVLFSTFAYCHSKESLLGDGEFLYKDPESQYLREWCFLSDTIADLCYQETAFIETMGNKRHSKEQNKQSQLQGCLKRSTGAQGLHVVTGGCCAIKILQVCGYLGVPSFPAGTPGSVGSV